MDTRIAEASGLLERELRTAEERFVAANPRSRALHEAARAVMPGGNTRSVLFYDPFPLSIAASAGARLRDADGHEYLDVLGEYSAGLFGHSDPVIREAVLAALDRGLSNGGPGADEAVLARLFVERFPAVERVRFCNSGTEANLFAVSLARAATGRGKVACFTGGYHGGVLLTGGSPMTVPFDWVSCRYNDTAGTLAALEAARGDLAAVLVEPMQMNGGCIPAEPGFLAALRAHCSRTGALLIFDEVVTSRSGAGGMQGLTGILPDLASFGKYLGGGCSFGAFGGRADLMDRFDPARPDALPHAGTFNNNVLSMAAGVAALGRLFTPARAEALYAAGEGLRARLNGAAAARALPVRFTGCGSIMGAHFTARPVTCVEDLADEPKGLLKLLHLDLLADGIYAARRGLMTLSLPMTGADHALLAGAVERFLDRRAALIRAVVAA